jgi:hypothetical protein
LPWCLTTVRHCLKIFGTLIRYSSMIKCGD